MTSDTEHGRDPLGQALAVPVEPASGLAPTGFDPSRMAELAKDISGLSAHLKRIWDDVAKSEADAGWSGGWGIEERLHAVMFVGKETTRVVVQALDKISAAIATEAGTAETENTGSVHEGAGLQGIAQPQSVSGLSHTGVDRG